MGSVTERAYTGGKILGAGIYSGVPIEDYHGNTELFDGFSISSSGLRSIIQRPSKYWGFSPYNPNPFDQPEKGELEFGKAAHMLLLGERGFKERYVIKPDVLDGAKWHANRTVCKEWTAAQKKAGKSIITTTDIGHIRHIKTALENKEAVKAGILSGRIERSIFAKHNDIWLKVRPDATPNDSGDYVDLKTSAQVGDEYLSKAIYTNGYHIQAGLMRMVVRAVLGADAFTSFTFVFVEKAPPYDVRIMQLKDEDIDLGELQARRALDIAQECLRRGEWPGFDGFDQDISYVEMPSWSKTRIKIELELSA